MTIKKLTVKRLANEMAKGVEGWAADRGPGCHDGSESWAQKGAEWVRLTRDGVTVVLNLSRPLDSWERRSAFLGLTVEGHTLFDGRCFTRRGIDTYSCRLSSRKEEHYAHAYADLPSLLAGEYARCLAARERSRTAVPVPGLPFEVQPDWFSKSAEQLRRGQVVRLTPAGFGTGFYLLPRAGRGAARAVAELERRLGVGPVYVESFDHD